MVVENMQVRSVARSSENILSVAKQVFVWKERMKHGISRLC
jgi:hypothetical protein